MLFVNVCFCIFVIICVKLGRHGTQDKFQSDLTIKYYLILSYLILIRSNQIKRFNNEMKNSASSAALVSGGLCTTSTSSVFYVEVSAY